MPRFFTDPIEGAEALLTGEDAAHLTRSLRAKPGESVTLCDSSGYDYDGEILSVGETVRIAIRDKYPSSSEPKLKVTLFQALPKGDKMEWIVQKAVELGVHEIVPILTERCISRPDAKSMEKKQSRWQKTSAEAAKQSGRGIIPQVGSMLTLAEAAARVQNGIVFYEKGGKRLPELIDPTLTEVGIFVGSEGGFSQEEIELLTQHGIACATLGPRILRCETAPLCALSVLLSLTGDI